jgi:hypothetical protein
MSTATRIPGETIRVIEYVKIKIRSRGKIIEAPVPEEMRDSEIHAMAHQYTNWGAEKTQMRVQEAHEDGHWKEDEEITIEAATPKVHLELKHKGRKIRATLAASTTMEQLEEHARKGFEIEADREMQITCWVREVEGQPPVMVEPIPLRGALYEVTTKAEMVEVAVRIEQGEDH